MNGFFISLARGRRNERGLMSQGRSRLRETRWLHRRNIQNALIMNV